MGSSSWRARSTKRRDRASREEPHRTLCPPRPRGACHRACGTSFSPLTCCRGTTLCGGQSLLSPELHDHAPRGLLMTSKFDPDGLVKRRTLGPSQSGIGPARDLEGVAGQNSCFLRSQPPDAPPIGACGPARWERGLATRLPLPPPMGGSKFLLGPAAPAQGWAGARGPDRHWGRPRAAKDPPGVAGPGGGGWRE